MPQRGLHAARIRSPPLPFFLADLLQTDLLLSPDLGKAFSPPFAAHPRERGDALAIRIRTGFSSLAVPSRNLSILPSILFLHQCPSALPPSLPLSVSFFRLFFRSTVPEDPRNRLIRSPSRTPQRGTPRSIYSELETRPDSVHQIIPNTYNLDGGDICCLLSR